jgi:hypothetical protein
VLVELALAHPGCVERLVLQGPTPDPEARGIVRQIAGFFAIAPFERWSLAWVALTDYARGGVRRYVVTLRSMIGNQIGEKLPGSYSRPSWCGARAITSFPMPSCRELQVSCPAAALPSSPVRPTASTTRIRVPSLRSCSLSSLLRRRCRPQPTRIQQGGAGPEIGAGQPRRDAMARAS